MKILITGAKGQLGYDCVNILSKKHEITATDVDELDITNIFQVEKAIQDIKPDIVLNCAAYTQVDKSEIENEKAWNLNVIAPKNLAVSIRKFGGKLIHISTDYIFDGAKKPPEPYFENDLPNPLSFYGKSKYNGEIEVQKTQIPYMIIRTAWLYGINGNNFLKTMLKLALKNPNNAIRVVNDQYGSPTFSYSLALQIDKMIDEDVVGLYHSTSEEYCTWFDLASYFLKKIDLPHTIIPCNTEEYPSPAKRPKNSILENQNLKKLGINIMPPWCEDIDKFITFFK